MSSTSQKASSATTEETAAYITCTCARVREGQLKVQSATCRPAGRKCGKHNSLKKVAPVHAPSAEPRAEAPAALCGWLCAR